MADIVLLIVALLIILASAVAVGLGAAMVKSRVPLKRSLRLVLVAMALVWLPWIVVLYFEVGALWFTLVLAISQAWGVLEVLRRGLEVSYVRASVSWVLFFVSQVAGLFVLAELSTGQAAADKARQSRTVADIRSVGYASMAWLTDQVAAAGRDAEETNNSADTSVEAAAPDTPGSAETPDDPSVVDATHYSVVSYDEVRRLLHEDGGSFYLEKIPELDGWGHPIEYRFNLDDLQGRRVLFIRSPGKDGTFESDRYDLRPFDVTDHDSDIVWADGFFIRWPERRR